MKPEKHFGTANCYHYVKVFFKGTNICNGTFIMRGFSQLGSSLSEIPQYIVPTTQSTKSMIVRSGKPTKLLQMDREENGVPAV